MAEERDPFATSAPDEPAGDEFGQPATGGKYPKLADLIGELLLIAPVKIESVPKYKGQPGEMSDRLTADVIILTGERAGEEYTGMWIGNTPIVESARAHLRTGQKMSLGRIRRFPQSDDTKKGLYSGGWPDIEQAFLDFRAGILKEPPRYAIAQDQYTDDEAQTARGYLKARKR